MKKIALLLILLGLTTISPCFSAEESLILPNIFIWSIPEDVNEEIANEPMNKDASENEYINSDEITLDLNNKSLGEKISATTLKGFAEYKEGVEAIYLKDDKNNYVLNIRQPQKIESEKLVKSAQSPALMTHMTGSARYSSEEYTGISKSTAKAIEKVGGLTFGTMFSQEVDYSQLEEATSLFTRYDTKRFALTSSYRKTLGTTHGNYADSLYVIPELKINNIFSIQEVFKADITRNRKTSELVLNIKPFGNQGSDRLNFELGAGQTFDDNNELMRTKVRFSTKFKL